MKNHSPYGNCYRCQNPVLIPGLDSFLCGSCGWTQDSVWLKLQAETAAAAEGKGKGKKAAAAVGGKV